MITTRSKIDRPRGWWVVLTLAVLGQVTSPWGILESQADVMVDFDELNVWTHSGAQGSYYNGNGDGTTNSDGWSSGGVEFGNHYNANWGGFWNGFAYSNVNDPLTPGFGNQYAAITGTGFGGDGNYAVAYAGSATYFNLPTGYRVSSVMLTNTTYAALSMRDGDTFGKRFGGISGDDPDYLFVRLTGYQEWGGVGQATGHVDFYLADFRFTENQFDYIVQQWTEVDLSSLQSANSVRLSFFGSDMGAFGLNTPAYVALDQLRLTAIPEPMGLGVWGTLALMLVGRRSSRRDATGPMRMERDMESHPIF